MFKKLKRQSKMHRTHVANHCNTTNYEGKLDSLQFKHTRGEAAALHSLNKTYVSENHR